MNKTQMLVAIGAILCAAVGGGVVWSVMTFTIVERAALASLNDDRDALGECVVERGNVISAAQDAKAETERLKASEQR